MKSQLFYEDDYIMKKAFLLASILFISVISTACINNFAVQELNSKAKEFMDKGDYVSAIERLKSSVDLDGSVFETRYNLAVAYTQAEDYENAVSAYKEAMKLNPDFADTYYSLAVCQENLAKDIISGEIIVDENNVLKKTDIEEETDKKVLTDNSLNLLTELLNDAVLNYNLYLEKSNAADKDEINSKVEELNELLKEHKNVSVSR